MRQIFRRLNSDQDQIALGILSLTQSEESLGQLLQILNLMRAQTIPKLT
jgi:hypothetical protein